MVSDIVIFTLAVFALFGVLSLFSRQPPDHHYISERLAREARERYKRRYGE